MFIKQLKISEGKKELKYITAVSEHYFNPNVSLKKSTSFFFSSLITKRSMASSSSFKSVMSVHRWSDGIRKKAMLHDFSVVRSLFRITLHPHSPRKQ